MAVRKTCRNTGCSKRFTPSGRQIYCGVKCKKNAAYKRGKKDKIEIETPVIKSTSRGAEYQTFVEEYAAKLEDNTSICCLSNSAFSPTCLL